MNKYKRKEEVEAIQYFKGVEIPGSVSGETLGINGFPKACYVPHYTGEYRRVFDGDWAVAMFGGKTTYMVMRDEEFKEIYGPIPQTLELAIGEIVKEHGVCKECNNTGRKWSQVGWTGEACNCKESRKAEIIKVLDTLCDQLLEDYDRWSGIYDSARNAGVTKVEEKHIMTVKGKMYGSRDAWKRVCKFRDSLKEKK